MFPSGEGTTVQKIYVDGLKRTKNDIVVKHMKPIYTARNFEEMILKSQQARTVLQRLGLFKQVRIGIDISRGPAALPDGYEVTFDVSEPSAITGSVSTMVGTNDGSVLFSVRMPNVFGRGEKINTEYAYGTKNAVGLGLTFTKPIKGDPNLIYQASVFQNIGEFPWSSYKELDRGVVSELLFSSMLGHHSLRWEGVWRDLSCLSRSVAFAVREQCGHTVKSSLKELAGVGGDIHFWKTDAEIQYNVPLIYDSVLQFCAAGGIMEPLRPGSKFTISDRFFIGGPLTLRGFNFKGAGPNQDGSALGADTYWTAGLHLYTPLPFRPGRGGFGDYFRLHGFLNAGNLADTSLKQGYKQMLSNLAHDLRWSYGVGVVARIGGIARLELNYCWPMRVQSGDSLNPGLQFGIGIHFL
ncbi:hypothetical protein LSH36_308g02016 [Paralvinella palmiformis]|uniref:Bacterial surface antigen (D15) domain-containing protein n=1 Tax=Paralvinella palmiformis TaxID=53620 RepID=A0AAD9N2I9_9ANNE|nr:hypothetical protein LSH36_308g02016 [Paralvinella palmiformis]